MPANREHNGAGAKSGQQNFRSPVALARCLQIQKSPPGLELWLGLKLSCYTRSPLVDRALFSAYCVLSPKMFTIHSALSW